jgi:formylglycine-generating enzyme required for sulfatase activity
LLPPSPGQKVKPVEPETVHIPAGSFMMGTSDQQIDWLARHTDWAEQWRKKGRFDRERPQQSVTLPDYAIARYPVTVG